MKEGCLQRTGGANGSICGLVLLPCKASFSHPSIKHVLRKEFFEGKLIYARKRMMLKPEHVDALSLLGWHAMCEKELLKQGE